MSAKLYLLGFIIAIVVGTVIILVFNIFRFPLSRNNINGKMSIENVVNIAEHQGVLVYVVEASDSFIASVFVESMIFNRFRLHSQLHYNFGQTEAFSVPGKRYHVSVWLHGISVSFPPIRIYRSTLMSPHPVRAEASPRIGTLQILTYYMLIYLGIMILARDIWPRMQKRNFIRKQKSDA